MLLVIISRASGETLYCARTFPGSLTSTFLKSGSLAALSRISLIISASFCLEFKQTLESKSLYIILVYNWYIAAANKIVGVA